MRIFPNHYKWLIGLLFFACSNSRMEPDAAVRSFLTAVDKHDFYQAEKYVTENYKESLENIRRVAGNTPVKENKYNYTLEERETALLL